MNMDSQVNLNDDQVIAPKQQRSRDTQERLVRATLKLLERHRFEEIGVASITDEADVAVGTFYRRFKSKEALLPLLYDVYNQKVDNWLARTRKRKGFRAGRRIDRIRCLVRATLDLIDETRGLMRTLHLNSRIHEEIVPDGAVKQRTDTYSAMGALIVGDEPSAEESSIARVMVMIIVSTCIEYRLYPAQTPTAFMPLNDTDLVKHLSRSTNALFE